MLFVSDASHSLRSMPVTWAASLQQFGGQRIMPVFFFFCVLFLFPSLCQSYRLIYSWCCLHTQCCWRFRGLQKLAETICWHLCVYIIKNNFHRHLHHSNHETSIWFSQSSRFIVSLLCWGELFHISGSIIFCSASCKLPGTCRYIWKLKKSSYIQDMHCKMIIGNVNTHRGPSQARFSNCRYFGEMTHVEKHMQVFLTQMCQIEGCSGRCSTECPNLTKDCCTNKCLPTYLSIFLSACLSAQMKRSISHPGTYSFDR